MRARIPAALIGATLLTLLLPTAGAAGLRLPDYETATLDNGLTLLVMERDGVPLVSLELWILAGSTADPQGKEGLAALTAEALRKGAGDRDAAAFAEALDFLGARWSAAVDHDRTVLRLECLSKDLEAGLDLFTDALLRPRFDAEEVDKLTAQAAEGVAQAKDNPRWVLGEYHAAHLFAGHPYGRPVDGTEESLPGLTADDLRDFHAARYRAGSAFLAVVGDVEAGTVTGRLADLLAGMPAGGAGIDPPPPPQVAPGRRVLLVDKADTPQTWFRIGHRGPSWRDDDFAACEVVRTVFGGRFTSWLNTKLRIESGLTYGAGFTLARNRAAGSAYLSSFTGVATTAQALDLALAQLDRLHEEGLNAEELASAKAYVKGQTPYDYEGNQALAATLCRITAYGLGRGHVDGFFDAVDAVSLEDCRRAVERWFPRRDLVFTCIAPAAQVRDVLAAYGDLQVRPNAAAGFAPVPVP
jgi:predicted Zn-dependent peptidase